MKNQSAESLIEQAEQLMSNFVTTADAAKISGFTTHWLKLLRRDGKGPRYIRVGISVMYPISEIEKLKKKPLTYDQIESDEYFQYESERFIDKYEYFG